MTTPAVSRSVRPILALLVFSPLLYSNDGDPYRAFEVVIVALAFVAITTPSILSYRRWVASGLAWALPILLLVILQPALVEGTGVLFNVKFAVALAASLIPGLSLTMVRAPTRESDVLFVARALRMLFYLTGISLLVSALTGIGEVYSADGGALLQRRSFSWLGDSFSPVMVFFLFYFVFSRRFFLALVAFVCIVFIMQAKMAFGMALLGGLAYLVITGGVLIRTLLTLGVAVTVVALPSILVMLSVSIHNLDYTINNRLLSLYAGFEFFRSSPWLGIGVNQSFAQLSGYGFSGAEELLASEIPFYDFYQIHNAYVRTLAELGAAGTAMLLALSAVILMRSLRCIRGLHAVVSDERNSVILACALWLLSFVLFFQTTGWFEPGHPQLAWLITFYALMNYLGRGRPAGAASSPHLASGRPRRLVRIPEPG